MELIINGKTISLNHYLNKSLKPKIDSEGFPTFPIYTKVIYQTKVNRFKATYDHINFRPKSLYVKMKDDIELDNIIYRNTNHKIFRDLIECDKKILKIAEFEILNFKDKFTLVGFSKRIQKYGVRINDFIFEAAKDFLLGYLADHVTHNEYKQLERYSSIRQIMISPFFKKESSFIDAFNTFYDKDFFNDVGESLKSGYDKKVLFNASYGVVTVASILEEIGDKISANTTIYDFLIDDVANQQRKILLKESDNKMDIFHKFKDEESKQLIEGIKYFVSIVVCFGNIYQRM